jgi:hypothetical protein
MEDTLTFSASFIFQDNMPYGSFVFLERKRQLRTDKNYHGLHNPQILITL